MPNKTMVFNIKKAFSLIELSIVILIIGILVTGVTQSSRLVSRIKLISLQSLTRSTDVVTVNGLSLWLETVLDNSITNSSGSFQISDNEAVSSWNDINPQVTTKINLTQSNGSFQPIYKTNGINGLPGIAFNGVNNILFTMPIVPISLADKDYTFVVVWKTNGQGNQVMISQTDNPGSCYQLASIYVNGGVGGFAGGCNDYMPLSIASQTNYISIVTVNNNLASNNVSIYTNSNTPLTGTTSAGSGNLSIGNGNFSLGGKYLPTGAGQYFNGIISEVMIFERALKIDEIKIVNSYLSKKFSIKVQ